MIIDFNNINGGGGGYELPIASSETLGGIKVGQNLTIESDGTLSADAQAVATATTAQTGVVKIGSGIDVAADGTISVSGGGASVVTATTAVTGVVKVGDGLDITEQGTLSTKVQSSNVGNNIVHVWIGTQTEYDNLSPNYDNYTLYIINPS